MDLEESDGLTSSLLEETEFVSIFFFGKQYSRIQLDAKLGETASKASLSKVFLSSV